MDWDTIYRTRLLKEIPWHSETPPKSLVIIAEKLKKGSVLDVCCGAGTNSIFLAKKGFKVKGIDISPKAIEIAKKRALEEKTKIDFKQGSVLGLEEKNSFDFILDRGCFHHIPWEQKPVFIKKIHSALRPNGKYLLIAFSENDYSDKGISKEQIHMLFSGKFHIDRITETLRTEPSGKKRALYNVILTKQ